MVKSMERKLIQRYLTDRHDTDFLRYLIDTIYDDMVVVCDLCGKGLIFEVMEGDYGFGLCDNCHKKYSYL